LFQIARPLAARDDNSAGRIAAQAAVEQAERRYDRRRLVVLRHGQRLLHLRVGIAQRVLAERHRYGAEMIAAGAVEMHVPRGPEGVRRDCAEIAVFRAEFVRQQAVRAGLVSDIGFLGGVCARPRISAEADDYGRGHASLDRHGGKRDAENLAGAAIVQCRGEPGVDAEPCPDLLMMGIALVGTAADDPVDIGHLQASVNDGVVHGLDQKIEARHPRHAAEAAMPGADDGADVAQLA
jgi:hypothetical protein